MAKNGSWSTGIPINFKRKKKKSESPWKKETMLLLRNRENRHPSKNAKGRIGVLAGRNNERNRGGQKIGKKQMATKGGPMAKRK